MSWQSDASNFELEESTDAEFLVVKTLYRGADRSSVRSGMADGKRYYRVRAIEDEIHSNWSNIVKVEVAHHPLSRAFAFLAVGIFVFLATVVMIIHGTKENQ